MVDREFDAIVIGGGPGGYVCAIRLGQLGQKTLCIEEEEVGGVCLNWGCIPSKALIANAHFYSKAQTMAAHGISIESVSVDSDKMQDWKNGIVKKLTGGVRGLLKSNGVELVEGTAKLVGQRSVEIKTKSGAVERATAKKGIVVATGSATIQVPGFEFDGERVIGAREAVSLRHVPKRLVVIGGGVIGLELGMVYQAFRSQGTVTELTPTHLPGTDPDCVKVVERQIVKHGGTVLKTTRAESYKRQPDGSLVVTAAGNGQTQELACDVVLVAV